MITAEGTVQIILVVLGGINAVVLAIVTPFAVKIANRTKDTTSAVAEVKTKTTEIHDQTVNHHPASPNMREEHDHRHTEIVRILKHVEHKVSRQADLVDELVVLGLENRYMIEGLKKGKDNGD